MTPFEFFLLYDATRPRDEHDYAGGLSENDCAELYALF